MKLSYTSVSGLYGSDCIVLGGLVIPPEEESRAMDFIKRKIRDSFEGHLKKEPMGKKCAYSLEVVGKNGNSETLGYFSPDIDLPEGESKGDYLREYAENVIGFTLGPIFPKESKGEEAYRIVLRKC